MSRIFISYKRVDKDKVFKIKDQIESALGEKCWIDLDGIESDAQFKNVIIKAINQCEIILFMYSRAHSKIENFETDWTVRELNFASKKNKRIVFINLDGSLLTDAFEFDYGTKQQVDARSALAVSHLLDDLKKWLSISPLITSSYPPKSILSKKTFYFWKKERTLADVIRPHRIKRILKITGYCIATFLALVILINTLNDSTDNVEYEEIESEVIESTVDLGLPSGTLWADKNLYASEIEEDGLNFAFGEIESKDDYPESTGSQYAEGESIIGTEHDVVTVKYGKGWQLPSKEQVQELIDYCNVEAEEKGYKVIGPNGNVLFLPYTTGNGGIGYYWTGNAGFVMEFQKEAYVASIDLQRNFAKYCALSIRPVRVKESPKQELKTESKLISAATGSTNGHDYVDLGLSVKWAKCNIGADSPTQKGEYFTWGSASPTKNITTYNEIIDRQKMKDISGDKQFDAATAIWGEPWCMPTASEIKELKERCTFSVERIAGKTGCLIKGPNGNTIFLVAGGCAKGTGTLMSGEACFYWTSTPSDNYIDVSDILAFHGGLYDWAWGEYGYGRLIRPVVK